MASVYILHSASLDKFYTGSCKDLTERINEHLSKKFPSSFTVVANDWQLFLEIGNLSYNQARNIEAHIKRMKSKKYIRNLM